ncbi:methyl-accepting chemotaxis protein [Paraburkholderia phosphatilytica]|uniref:methyl-accepting chemotaxis protein n=1 Tax=Paraburkholderia phosphatilytica TaxID=2282883 RepID=UPI000E4D76E6|nr:methyl-accepting chemotaxis protein [Paraburkholderia phosphatilytica]
MFNNISIRTRLTLTICAFVGLLLTVIVIGYGAIKLASESLVDTQRSSIGMSTLKTSSEKLLQVRLALGSYETLFSVGKQTDDLLPNAHKVLVDSNGDFQHYLAGPFANDDEKRLAQAVAQARAALVDQAIEPEFKALNDNDFNTFRTIQGETANTYYAAYAKAIDALEKVQGDSEQQATAAVNARFHFVTLLFVAIGVIAIVVGLVARAGLAAAIVRPVNRMVEHFQSIAAGDLTIAVGDGSRSEMGQLIVALRQMRDGLSDTVSKVRGSSGAIAHGVKEIAAGNLDLSRRTEQQAAALERTAASIEQLSSTVKQNEDNAREANRLAQGALQTVVRGGEVVERVVDTMDGITESSRKVKDITGIIEGIAFQTNILALNAAVEAARAGEQGRGFAVVASEVRSLAQRSGTAAKEIKELIGDSAAQVEQGASLVQQAGKTMSDAMQAVERMTRIMAEIESAAAEQSSGIEQVNQAISQIDEVTQNNVALVEEAAAAAKSLEEQTEVLHDAVAVFQVDGHGRSAGASASGERASVRAAEPVLADLTPLQTV